MTISSETRKAGPYTGNGSQTSFPFSFKVFTTADVQVIRTDLSLNETTLVLGTDYTVTLNSNQDSNPGGSITTTTAPASGFLITLTSQVGATQATDLTNQGGFYPNVLNTALDKLTILVQQLKEQVNRAVKTNISSSTTPDQLISVLTSSASASAASASAAAASATSAQTSLNTFRGQYYGTNTVDPTLDPLGNPPGAGDLYFNTTSNAMRAYNGSVWQDVAQGVSFPYQSFSGNGSTATFTLSSNPGSLSAIEVFVSGVRQRPVTDYTWSGGTSITLIPAPPTGTNNVFVRWVTTQALAVPSDGSVTAAKLATTGTPSASRVLRGDMVWSDPRAVNGITTVTLTSASPNATLTSASNQHVLILNDTTTPFAPSVTLPNMTTLVAGTGYFVFSNTTPYNVALRDAGGTVREYIAPGTDYSLNIKDVTTSNGQWNIAFPSVAVSVDQTYLTSLANGSKVNSGWIIGISVRLVRLDTTNFALVWTETLQSNSNTICYARLFTVNPSTKAVTTGNTLAAYNFGTAAGSAVSQQVDITYDTDNAGHALILCVGAFNQPVAVYFGLSVSGGTLYATTATNTTAAVVACQGPYSGALYVGYMGSSNAFALSFYLADTSPATTIHIRACTVTGTTAPVLTNSANNTSFATNTLGAHYGARTDLTTFLCGANGTIGRAISYTPASNTFSVATRTNQARFDIEQGSTAILSSFAQGGFMFSSGKAFFGANVFDVTNPGATSVTATLSTSFNFKPNFGSAYTSTKGGNIGTANRSSIYVSGTSMIAVDGTNRFQCDPSQTTLNLQRSAGINTALNAAGYAPLLLDTNLPLYWTWSGWNNTGATLLSASTLIGDVATPITL